MFGKLLNSMGRKSALYNIKCEILKMNVSFPHAPANVSGHIRAFLECCIRALDMGVDIGITDIEKLIHENAGSSAKRQLQDILVLLARLADSSYRRDIQSVNHYDKTVQSLYRQSTGTDISF